MMRSALFVFGAASDGGTVRFEDWVKALVGGAVTNVGP